MLIRISYKGSEPQLLTGLLQVPIDKVHVTEMTYGKSLVFCSIAEADLTEVCILLEVNANQPSSELGFAGTGHPLRQFVNHGTYSSNSRMSLAIANSFKSAIQTANKTKIPLEITITSVVTSFEVGVLHSWWKPLGWQLNIIPAEYQPSTNVPGAPAILDLRIRGNHTISDALLHLQALLCALDQDRRFFLSDSELQLLVDQAGIVLSDHPYKNDIVSAMVGMPDIAGRNALGNLFEEDDVAPLVPLAHTKLSKGMQAAWEQSALALLSNQEFSKILLLFPENDVLLAQLAADESITQVTASHIDVPMMLSIRDLINASNIPTLQKMKLALVPHSPLLKLESFRGMSAVVVEHAAAIFPSWHLPAITSMVFGFVGAKRVIWLGKAHPQFENWASSTAKSFGYAVYLQPLSDEFPDIFVAIFDL